MPFVSVVLPVFNGARTLAIALGSVLSQTFRDFELIVVDDGSEDETPIVLHQFAQRDDRLVPIRTANFGLVHALNAGAAAARGRYIARMDADDICEPARFEKQVNFLEANRACVAAGTALTLIDEAAVELSNQPRLPQTSRLKDRCRDFRHFPPSPPTIPHPSAMMRSDALRAAGVYRPYFRSGAEDRDLWWRLSELGAIECLPERLLRYRTHNKNRSSALRGKMVADAIVCDLSAVARHFDVDDQDLLKAYAETQDVQATVTGYAERIGDRYPVRTLVKFRALTRGSLAAGGWETRSEAARDAARQLLKAPLSTASWRLASAAVLR